MCDGNHGLINTWQTARLLQVSTTGCWLWGQLNRVFLPWSHFSVPDLEDFSESPILTKVNCLLKRVSLSLLYSTFLAYKEASEQSLPESSMVLYLITVLWTLHTPPANFTALESCLGDRHRFFPQSILNTLPSGIFSNLWLANGCHIFRILQPENFRVVVQKCLIINK